MSELFKVINTYYPESHKYIGITACSGEAFICGGRGNLITERVS